MLVQCLSIQDINLSQHAVWNILKRQYPRMSQEPYFEDEPLPELGWSLEDKVSSSMSSVYA